VGVSIGMAFIRTNSGNSAEKIAESLKSIACFLEISNYEKAELALASLISKNLDLCSVVK
jgi:hypothetical protein